MERVAASKQQSFDGVALIRPSLPAPRKAGDLLPVALASRPAVRVSEPPPGQPDRPVDGGRGAGLSIGDAAVEALDQMFRAEILANLHGQSMAYRIIS